MRHTVLPNIATATLIVDLRAPSYPNFDKALTQLGGTEARPSNAPTWTLAT